jgi:hypothetical protein
MFENVQEFSSEMIVGNSQPLTYHIYGSNIITAGMVMFCWFSSQFLLVMSILKLEIFCKGEGLLPLHNFHQI